MKTLQRRMEVYFVLKPGLVLKIAWGKSAIDLGYVKNVLSTRTEIDIAQQCYG